MTDRIYIKEELLTQETLRRYYLNSELVSRLALIGVHINITGRNSRNVSDEQLKEIPGVEVHEEHILKPFIMPSGSGRIPQLIGLDEEFAYFQEYADGLPWKKWRVPVLRKAKEFILLDILKREIQSLHANGSYGPWKPCPGDPGYTYGY